MEFIFCLYFFSPIRCITGKKILHHVAFENNFIAVDYISKLANSCRKSSGFSKQYIAVTGLWIMVEKNSILECISRLVRNSILKDVVWMNAINIQITIMHENCCDYLGVKFSVMKPVARNPIKTCDVGVVNGESNLSKWIIWSQIWKNG